MSSVQSEQVLQERLDSLQEIVLPHVPLVEGEVLGTAKDNVLLQKLHTLRTLYLEEVIDLKGGLELKENTSEMMVQAGKLIGLAELSNDKLTDLVCAMYGEEMRENFVLCGGDGWQIVRVKEDAKIQCSCRECVAHVRVSSMMLLSNVKTMVRAVAGE